MALDNPSVEKKSQKKIVIIVLLVVVVAIVLYEISTMFGSSSAPEVVAAANQQAQEVSKTANPEGNNARGANATANPTLGSDRKTTTPQSTAPTQVAVSNDVTMNDKLLAIQKEFEDSYIKQVNKLQSLKLQREIEDMNQAIAVARLATVTADKNVGDILTAPAPALPPVVPAGAYRNPLVNPVPSGSAVAVASHPVNAPPAALTEIPYVVISVSMQLGRWNAVVGYQGKLFNVAVGDVLPIDGAVVTSINRNGVTLMKDGKHKKVAISSSI